MNNDKQRKTPFAVFDEMHGLKSGNFLLIGKRDGKEFIVAVDPANGEYKTIEVRKNL